MAEETLATQQNAATTSTDNGPDGKAAAPTAAQAPNKADKSAELRVTGGRGPDARTARTPRARAARDRQSRSQPCSDDPGPEPARRRPGAACATRLPTPGCLRAAGPGEVAGLADPNHSRVPIGDHASCSNRTRAGKPTYAGPDARDCFSRRQTPRPRHQTSRNRDRPSGGSEHPSYADHDRGTRKPRATFAAPRRTAAGPTPRGLRTLARSERRPRRQPPPHDDPASQQTPIARRTHPGGAL